MKYILVIIGALSVGFIVLSSPLQSASETTNVALTADQSSNVIPGFKVFAFYDGNEAKLLTNHQQQQVETNQNQQVDKPITNFHRFDYGNSQQGDHDISSNELPNSKWFQQKPTSGAFSAVKPNQQTIIIRPNVMYDDSYIFNSPTNKQQKTMYSDNPLADVDRNFPKIQNPLSRPADNGPIKTSAPDYLVNSEFDHSTLMNFDEPSGSYHFLADTSFKPDFIDISNGKHQPDNDDDFITYPTSFKHFLPSGNDKQQNSQDFQKNFYKSPPNYASIYDGDQITDKDNARKRPSPNYHSDLDNAQQKSGKDYGFTGSSKQYNNYFVANNDDKVDTEDGATWTDDNPSVGVGTYQSDEDKNHIFQHSEPSTDYASTQDGKLKPPHNDNDFLKKTKSSDGNNSFSDDGQQQSGDEYSYMETPEHGDDFSYPISNTEKPYSDDYNTFSKDNKPSTVDHDEYNHRRENEDQQSKPVHDDNPDNQATNENPQNGLTNGNPQNQLTNENPQNPQNKSSNENVQSPTTNENLPSPSTSGNQNNSAKSNHVANENPQGKPTNENVQNPATNGNLPSPSSSGNQNNVAKPNQNQNNNGGQGKKKKKSPKPLKVISNTVNKVVVKPIRKLFKGKG